jgi:hypothetical protein
MSVPWVKNAAMVHAYPHPHWIATTAIIAQAIAVIPEPVVSTPLRHLVAVTTLLRQAKAAMTAIATTVTLAQPLAAILFSIRSSLIKESTPHWTARNASLGMPFAAN